MNLCRFQKYWKTTNPLKNFLFLKIIGSQEAIKIVQRGPMYLHLVSNGNILHNYNTMSKSENWH